MLADAVDGGMDRWINRYVCMHGSSTRNPSPISRACLLGLADVPHVVAAVDGLEVVCHPQALQRLAGLLFPVVVMVIVRSD